MSIPLPAAIDPLQLSRLGAVAQAADGDGRWPAESLKVLGEAGVWAWSIPVEFGGAGFAGPELLAGYERLAGSCLTTAFILSQREAAVRRLVASENKDLARRWLVPLARGEAFATVGLSQLTTSRQHQAPALQATLSADGIVLDGVIPWVTGADAADLIVIGATLPDQRQVLIALPRRQAGVAVEAPLPLMALAGSRTSLVRCEGVQLKADALVAGPAEKIMAGKPGGVGGLETSCLALGHAGAAIQYMQQEAEQRPDLTSTAEQFEKARQHLRTRLLALAVNAISAEEMVAIRVACTELALQASQVALTTAKGAGFLVTHPAQRWARQALFFLVWSCPRPAAEGVISRLLPDLP
jgi:alkylation response protein AidB-like acyl-CoA dehydrogenase